MNWSRRTFMTAGAALAMSTALPAHADEGTRSSSRRRRVVSVTMSSSEHSQDQGWFWNLKDESAAQPGWRQTSAVAAGRPIPLMRASRNGAAGGSTAIAIDDRRVYQTMTGMGASVDGSTVANWLKMSPINQTLLSENISVK